MQESSKIILLLCFFCFFHSSYSQDVHFSQRLASFSKKNPALMGNYEGNWRAIIDHRRQWQSIAVPYLTSALMYNHKFYPSLHGKRILAGFNYINDKSGDAKLSINQIELAAAYEQDYFENTFSAGFQVGYIHKQFSDAQLTFPEQYDRNIGDFNTNLSSGENFAANQFSMIQFNLGLAWKRILNERWTAQLGYSIFNLNRAAGGFTDWDEPQNLAYAVQMLAIYQLLEHTTLRPSLEYSRSSAASELFLGSNIHQELAEKKIDGVFGGLHFRNGFARNNDAVILNAGLSFNAFDFGVAYDFNVSDLQIASNYKGGFEFILIITEVSKLLQQKTIPCERY